MADSSSETGSSLKNEAEVDSNEEQDVVEEEVDQQSDAEDETNSQAESEGSEETHPPSRSREQRTIIMICLPSLSTEFPVLQTNSSLERVAKIYTFPLQPRRFLGEKGSVENLDDIVEELLAFVHVSAGIVDVTLSEISIIFTASDLSGIFVKKASTDVKYRPIFEQTSLLFFFGTPHHASEVSSWEETILRIVEDTYRGLRGPWFPDRIHQLSRYIERLRLDFNGILDHFNIINYFQDMPESSPEVLTVHKSCTELQGFNVTNIGVNATHYELHCFISETAGEDFIVDRVCNAPIYLDEDFRQFVEWLSLESDGMETSFQISESLHNLANSIVHSVELGDFVRNGRPQAILLELGVEVDGRDFLSCFRDEIRQALPPYPGSVIACTLITAAQPSSLTETGLLSSCLIQLLRQRPKLSSWLRVINERLTYALRVRNTELKIRTLWECLRLVFTHTSHIQGFWLIHTTGGSDQYELILRIIKRLQYFDELDEISWKVIIVNDSAFNIDLPSSKSLSKARLDHGTIISSIEKDVTARLDSIMKMRSLAPSFKGKALRLFRTYPSSQKVLGFFMDALQSVNPPIPEVLADLTDSFPSMDMAFRAILDRVPKHYHAWVRKIMGFLSFSCRNLSLDELAVAIVAKECKNFEQLRENINGRIGEYIQELLPGIIRISSEGIFLTHDNLKSFLQRSPHDAWYHIKDFHLEFTTTSYNYLSLLLDQPVDTISKSLKSTVEWMRRARAAPGNVRENYVASRGAVEGRHFGFALYAAQYWYDHYLSANDTTASELPKAWLTNPDRLKEIIALRYHSLCRFNQDFCAPKEFMPLSAKEELNMSESESLSLTMQLIDREPSNKYIDIMYPPDSAATGVARNWIASNFPPLSISDIIACYPHEIERLFQLEENAIRANLSDILVSLVVNNDRSLLINFLKKVGEVGELASKALRYAVGLNLEHIAKALFEYLEITQKGFWFKLDILEILSSAIATGNGDMVQLLLDSGANVNSKGIEHYTDDNATPLLLACEFGFINIVRLLLNAGAKVDLTSASERTALHVASARGFPSISELLIKHRATIKLDVLRLSPLHNAARFSRIQRHKRVATMIIQALKDRWPRYKESGTQNAEDMSRIISARAGKKMKAALNYAAVAGNVDLVESLIDLGADVDVIESDGHTALCRVAMLNNADMVRCLLDNGAKVDYSRKDGRQPLHDACAWGASKAIELLLERNAVADQLDRDKMPPISVAATWGLLRGIRQMIPHSSKSSISRALIYAARYGYHEIVTALLDAGADINHQDAFGNTPLQFSCFNSNSRVTQILLARIPDINLQDNDKFTATIDAARRGELECLKLLLDAGADTEVEAGSGKRALIRAADVDEDCFRLLLERGAEKVIPESYQTPPAFTFKSGLSFLGGLAYGFKVGAVKVYLEYLKPRISEEAFAVEINEALAVAAYGPKVDTVQLLLEYGADPNAINPRFDHKHGSALGIAIAYDNIDVVEILLDNKFTPVDVNKVDDYRNTPLHIALDWGVTSILGRMIDLLIAHGADPTISSGTYGTVLNATCETGDDDIVHKILSYPGVSLDIPDDLGRLPLHLAAARRSYQPSRFEMLITEKSTAKSTDKQGRNALHHTATSGSMELLEKLVTEYPELIDVPDRDGWTPLHWACRQINGAITEYLIDHGANKQPRTHDRWTPLRVAIYHDQPAQIEHLPEEDDGSDDDNIPSQAADKVTEDYCDSCFCQIYGTGYRCGTCPKYWFCFKCYWHVEETHPDHVFLRFDQESHDIGTPPISGSEKEDT
ncbi:ankyrin repeat-containing domain protein [Annulohypoxylon truncatum]|uniref:ankyrin repeat-containing domain protein n=1 Tax=Annulohypoxylon truncatum TaxID=327061 RepID=UPI0020083A56|nr:ankyrin repeat-containing domain protein [Annulohypoxylon truncatum]KAI1208947.1 ankyrin repeat-containing domain protein [Annulohypoxylon truncatum]